MERIETNRPGGCWSPPGSAGFRREALLKENIFFFRDENGNPRWKDTYIYAMLKEDCPKGGR